MDAAERAAERRLRDAGLDVPDRLLSQHEAWAFAHAFERSVTVDGEMVDEAVDDAPAESAPSVRARQCSQCARRGGVCLVCT